MGIEEVGLEKWIQEKWEFWRSEFGEMGILEKLIWRNGNFGEVILVKQICKSGIGQRFLEKWDTTRAGGRPYGQVAVWPAV